MPFLVKLLITNMIIIVCTQIGRKFPTLGGLIATMPLTSLIVLVWLASDNPGDGRLLTDYTRGVLWGIIPTILFFAVVLFCFRRSMPLGVAIGTGAAVWLAAASLHQWLLR
ncbi:DUF3147 family protein [Geobacter sp. DSM 9736]|uniref:DUF3147 family protein n=1 Tax=Geobacter sp. DSM 9736 TaxID=1277350 RepID=UPI000B5002FA|nr:DUF3147 family protein [Geobacter sp. DSM 9736]SNB46867.1 hypothetical protein SAMN06269301_2338 [Geobacter sp. DSM 9736]